MTNHTTPHVLVTGATGKTGRRVARRLDDAGIAHRPVSRTAPTRFDWDLPHTWPAVLDGIDAVYLAYAPDLAVPGAVDTVARFCAAATEAGVTQVVLLAGRGEEEAAAAEDVVRSSVARWTIVRASWFAQNFTEDHLLASVLAGEIALPVGDVAEPFVDADDIADVAVATLTDPRHDHRTYDVTGPRLLTFADVADEIATATDRPIRYRAVTPDEYRAAAVADGVPEPVADLLCDLFVGVLDGRNSYVGTGVDDALGRPARDFTDFARRAANAGAWSAMPTETAR